MWRREDLGGGGSAGSRVQKFEGLFSLLKADLRQVKVDDELSNSQDSDLKRRSSSRGPAVRCVGEQRCTLRTFGLFPPLPLGSSEPQVVSFVPGMTQPCLSLAQAFQTNL